jgi:hypothetical protein
MSKMTYGGNGSLDAAGRLLHSPHVSFGEQKSGQNIDAP